MVLDLRPPVVSFHFGLPPSDTMKRIKQTGAVVLSSATTVAEARRLEAEGADAIIAQGLEAGGHRGTFTQGDGAGLIGTMALVPHIVDAVGVPVIAAGGIADGRGIAAAFALGASGYRVSRMSRSNGPTSPPKEPAIMVRELDATTRPAPQDNQLMSQHRVLGFKP